MNWPSGKRSAIGLDLGAHSFKAIQLDARGEVAATLSLPRQTAGGALGKVEMIRLCGVLDRRGFTGREVVIAVPGDDLLTSVLELPARAAGMPMEQLAVAEFSRVHRLDATALSISAWELPATARASKATYMLAVGAKTVQLGSHADVIGAAGLDVIAIDDPYSAAVRGCLRRSASNGSSNAGLIAVVDLGWSCATLAIVKGEVIVYTRDLSDSGLADIFREAEEMLAIRADDVHQTIWHNGSSAAAGDVEADVLAIVDANLSRVLKEIDQALRYATHQYPDALMNRVLLTGGGALIPGIAERFAKALDLPIGIGSGSPSPSAELVKALGLAIKPQVMQ